MTWKVPGGERFGERLGGALIFLLICLAFALGLERCASKQPRHMVRNLVASSAFLVLLMQAGCGPSSAHLGKVCDASMRAPAILHDTGTLVREIYRAELDMRWSIYCAGKPPEEEARCREQIVRDVSPRYRDRYEAIRAANESAIQASIIAAEVCGRVSR